MCDSQRGISPCTSTFISTFETNIIKYTEFIEHASVL